jgi:hypothetical protein
MVGIAQEGERYFRLVIAYVYTWAPTFGKLSMDYLSARFLYNKPFSANDKHSLPATIK